MPECFTGVNDLGAIDIQRGRDHGIGTYNQLRAAYGLPAKTSFTAITGESTDAFPADPLLTRQRDQRPEHPRRHRAVRHRRQPDRPRRPGRGRRHRHPRRAAHHRRRPAQGGLRHDVDKVDAFTGMIAEPHVPGTEFGETAAGHLDPRVPAAARRRPVLLRQRPGPELHQEHLRHRLPHTLARVIVANTDVEADELSPNVFLVADDDLPATTCSVKYPIAPEANNVQRDGQGHQQHQQPSPAGRSLPALPGSGDPVLHGALDDPECRGDQRSRHHRSGRFGGNTLRAHGSATFSFNSTWDGLVNSIPPNFSLNNKRCDSNH